MVDINKLIQNIKNEKLKKYFRMSFYEIKDSNLPMGESFLNEFKKDLLELFPNTYSDLEHYILNKDIFSYSNLLEDTFRLEHGYYNYKDIHTIKNMPKKGSYWWNSVYATWEYYYKGIEEGFYTFNDLINFLNDNMEYFEYLVPMFIEKGEEKEYEYLCNMIEEAKLQDNIRFTIFDKVFSGDNSSCILYFIKKINEKNYYRHKALKEATNYYCSYPLNFDSKQVIKIIEDAFNYKYEDYITSGFRKNYCFIKTLRKYNVNKYNEYIKEVLSTDNEMANMAVLAFYKYYKKIHKEELKFNEIIFLIMKKDISFEQLSYFPTIEIEDYNKVQAKQIFDYLLPYYDKMDKVNYHFKMTEDFPSAHDLSKTDMIKNLSKLAAMIDNKEVYDLLEQRTQTMGEEALSYFIEILQSPINMRKYAIQLIRSENYHANKVYNSLNMTISLEEAKIVSDYLKTKKESVKRQIIKEFEKSKEKKEIAYYLISCKEDYKIKIGEEMLSTLGLTKENKEDDNKEIKIDDKIKKFYKNTKVNLQKVNFISYKKIVSFYEKLEKFINNHKDYEYSTSNSDTTYTFGSMFVKLKFGDFSYEKYPLGKELKEEFSSFFTDEELITFVHCIADSICVTIKYKKYCDKKIIEYFQGICKSYSFKISLQLLLMLIYEFVDKKKLLSILVSIKCNYHDFMLNNTHTAHMIVDMYEIVNDLKDEESLKLWSYLIVDSIEKDSSKLIYWKVFAICVNEGILDFDFIKYYILNYTHSYIYLKDINGDTKKVLSFDNPNYEYLEFKKHMLTFMNEAVDAEVNRGAKDTIYSNYIFRLDKLYGVETYLKALDASRNITLVRGGYFWGTAKNVNISKILRNTVKIDTDTYEKFLELVNKYNFTKEELIKACLYNTSFIDYIDRYLNIPNFKLIIYYFIAHLNESLNEEKKEIFKQYSVIDYHDFKDGAFDHEWYEEMVKNLSKKDFKIIYDNVKYITVAGLHKRAQRFYDAKNNKITLEECKAKIEGTRNKDYVLIYSLIPLKDNNDLYERFIYIQDFLKESKKFGAQRQVSERRVVDIALDNLARLGGYIDTNLFIYEMEASKQIDVSDSLEVDDIVLKTKFDHLKIVIETYKNDKLIKLPTKYNKNDKVLEFKELVKTQQTKLKRITKSFEETMCNNISFTYDNIIKISKDQIIRYILSKLILLSDGKVSIFKEDHIEDLNGNIIIPNNIYIAHPIELYKNNCLNEAINYIITNNIKQPFKQILREFYTKSEQELQQQSCIRFRGFNVDIKKAIATLKSKSWGISEDVGLRKVFYYTNTIAILFREFDDFYYDDYEDYNRELHSITFFNRKTEEIIDLKDVNDITYSECLRDVDLMISISSNTIYDYELAMSTTEMRQAVLKSIIQILKLNNISFLKDNIKIEGHYGNYIINIRTGLVYMEGKGNLLVDTIYSSNKALLLDFVDEDPMTADIISKAIVLSNDKDIKASSILIQIK